jgi:REP element-mobilizing transposase RayT
VTYFITFSCYGARLHGDERGSVDRNHHLYGGPMLGANVRWHGDAQKRLCDAPYTLDAPRRKLVLQAIVETCEYRGWGLIAAHVRTNHVHLVIDADQRPEPVMTSLKAYASRALAKVDPPEIQRWSRHGSTRYLWTADQIDAAVIYVVTGQGDAMEVYERPVHSAH